MTEQTIVRASSLNDFPDCPRRWAAKNLWREILAMGYELRRLPRSVAAAIGTAVHAGAAVALTEKAKTGTLPPENVATDAARDEIASQLAGGVAFDDDTPVAADAKMQSVRMTRAYHETIAPTVHPILVERRLEAEAAPGIIVSGQLDVLANEPSRIRDLKTGKQRSNLKAQIGMYSLLVRSNTDNEVTEAVEDYVPRGSLRRPQKTPQSFIHPIAAAESAAVNVLAHIAASIRTFRQGNAAARIAPGDPWAFIANPASNLCSHRWCPAWGNTGPHAFCLEWRSKEPA